MKIVKYVFRVDYPINYSLIDKLGEYLDYISHLTKKEPYTKVKNGIDVSSHIISSSGFIKEDKFIITLSLESFNGEIEFKDSTNFNDIIKCQLFNLVEDVIEKLKSSNNEYKRIGLRIYVIDANENFKFDKILKYQLKLNESLISSVSKHIPEFNDIALTLESINDDKESIRINIGPYKAKENQKYFKLDPKIDEGLIIDLDAWQNKIIIPKFKIIEMIKQKINLYSRILPVISSNLLKELRA